MMTTEERLSSLEKEVKLYRKVAVCLVVLTICSLALAVQDKKQEKVIECELLKARRIEAEYIQLLPPREGKERTGEEAEPPVEWQYKQTPHLELSADGISSHGDPKFSLNGNGLVVTSGEKRVITLAVIKADSPFLSLRDPASQACVDLAFDNESVGHLGITNKLAYDVFSVGQDENGNGVVWTFDKKGKNGRSLKPGK